MYSGIDVEGNETEMEEELSKSISDPQSNRPTHGLGFTTLITRVRSYTLPDPNISGACQSSNRISPLSNFHADSNLDHEAESCCIKKMNTILVHGAKL